MQRIAGRGSGLCCSPIASAGVLAIQRRFLDYWSLSATSRTQPYAQGDMLPRVDNVRLAIHQSSSQAASITGNHLGIAYDSSNIFHVEDYSRLEKDHYQPFRGLTKHKVEPLQMGDGQAAADVMESLMVAGAELTLEELWWRQVLKDFPSLATPCTPAFREAWQAFYLQAFRVAHDDEAVNALSRPFVREQMQKNFISYTMFWRLAERLGDALEAAPGATRYERRASRMATERVTKLMLDTIADEPWANQDMTNPLYVDVSGFRAWHEAGNW